MSLVSEDIKGFAYDKLSKCPLSSTKTYTDLCIEDSCPAFMESDSKCFYMLAARFGLSLINKEAKLQEQSRFSHDFQTIFKENHDRIFKIALRMLKSREMAEDITQEVFVKAYKHMQDIASDVPLSAWLCKVTTNLCLDELRRQKLRKVEYCSDADVEEIYKKFQDCRKSDPDMAFIEKEDIKIVDKALRCLPPHYCQALIMKCVDGLTYEQIANTIDTTIPSVRSTIFRARKQFIKAYSLLVKAEVDNIAK